MQYLHSSNIIHGGLNASDILVKEDRHACITYYGITEIQSSKNSENHTYFSPEAWKGVSNAKFSCFLSFLFALY
ncbi:hypothetical protein K435DRAFT_733840 [Dendrothele bispora CBS 962.96]|uniref:Protein kinase domain-containing protein n=1 Tax=Dendrothele bispora (strain CBS 962.96) TaxID=1314807 RepID=A0A4S8L547_DENBC|nr:hypothetical protein K435DRAFT_733840 [Dendrothele bispora CBS 962.96]